MQSMQFEFTFNQSTSLNLTTPPTPTAPAPELITVTSEEAADIWIADKHSIRNWQIKKRRDQDSNAARTARRSAARGDGEQPAGGGTKQHEWIEVHVCSRSRTYKPNHKPGVDPKKRRPRRMKGTVCTKCPSRFTLRKRLDADAVDIEYHSHHNHEVGTMQAMSEEMLSKEQKEWVESKVAGGLDWAGIKLLLRLDSEILSAIASRATTDIPASLAIDYMVVYNAKRCQLAQTASLAKDGMESLRLWEKKLKAAGYWVLFLENITAHAEGESTWLFAFVSPWQQTLLQDYSLVSCLDSTHNTCFSAKGKAEKAFLYTIVLKNENTGKGVPAATMITSSEGQYAIYEWLVGLTSPVSHGGLGYQGRLWMIDCSDTEAAAIRSAIPSARVFICLWHVYKAVAEQAKKKLRAPGDLDRAEKITANAKLREDAVNDFCALSRCATPEAFEAMWRLHMQKYNQHPEWRTYLTSEWLPKRKQWVWAYRKDHCHYGIETNNYVESWHSILKMYYLKLTRRQRVDVLIYILASKVLPDFYREDTRVRCGFSAPALCTRERDSRALADKIPSEELESMVRVDLAGDGDKTPDMFVMSFTRDSDLWYRVAIVDLPPCSLTQLVKPVIASCDCPVFKSTALSCKHMFLASRSCLYPVRAVARLPGFTSSAAGLVQPPPQPQSLTQSISSYASSASLSGFLVTHDTTVAPAELAKQAAVARTLGEIRKLTSLGEKLAGMSLSDLSNDDILRIEGHATTTRRELTAAVEQRPMHARQRS